MQLVGSSDYNYFAKSVNVLLVRMVALLILLAVSVTATEINEWLPNVFQFVDFNDNTEDTASDDIPLSYADECDGPIINNANFMNNMIKFNREMIPERVVHAKGTGAFGYFELTNDMSHICKADFLKSVGKRTPVAVRFSTGSAERGSSDFARDSRGFAVKFYTNEGNLDLIGFHTQMGIIKDPLRFSTVVHGVKRMPGTNLYDLNTFWDVITLLPESLNFFINIFSDNGIPLNYRHMPGFPIHTYQFQNARGENFFCRFAMEPECGIKTIRTKDAAILGATDPDHAIRDLYEAIQKGDFPSWKVSLQIISMKDAIKDQANVFDPTRKLDSDQYPLNPIGRIVLNKNARHFRDNIDKLAFTPGNLVNGIFGSPDKLFESRVLIYRDTQLHRLGKNHNKIPANCPLNKFFTYNRDGMPPVGDNEGDSPNYYPNTFGGPQPYMDKQSNCTECGKGQGVIEITESPAYNTDQVVEFYNELTDEGREILCENLLQSLKTITPYLQKKAVDMLTSVHPDLGWRLAKAFNSTSSNNN